MKEISGGITSPQGFLAAGVRAGIKETGKDIALIYSETIAQVAAVFTTNQAAAAPVKLSKQNCQDGLAQAIIINSGNANACTGQQGGEDAKKMIDLTANELNIASEKVLVSSTGIIGKKLPMGKLTAGIKQACSSLDVNNQAAEAIMTTDTYAKALAVEFEVAGEKIKLGGIAKGSGMIEPNMATMLSFITTDLAIKQELLDAALEEAVNNSFNQITVDGDQSTNDTVAILANGQAKNKIVSKEDDGYNKFYQALEYICQELAQQIVKDGEGATKFVEVNVKGALNKKDADEIGKKIANSNLVKTALFGEDPNWGRIVAALGSTGIKVELDKLEVEINGQSIFGPQEQKYETANNLLEAKEVDITIKLNLGEYETQVWTCDLSYEYIEINAEYHT
ncbi:glutamate N-acetyltransferase/amino-acid acetyltransferase [Halobacteroides halobius DSM 5150]|uniref:Arginine biosynthesis bifunctional protein ArgJ n=1 Tax=Halobacteroides halobius (strain ATCC 35273 / DSM 5150 / MD-1) TaxID=748449 RepID=L0K630_HALHC|nr:bifunctional glutamate N-acetyltransferase/amino-acid acetyltransferase ArgJ [Halobacteroides halobius]AGB40727.1 glutamate N-acetyltransferase/amino-acid acetyltransferase [Halobacteroides halobius DSM 5150]